MQIQRKLNSSTPEGIAREGAAKKIVDAPIKLGMVRQTSGEMGYHHGVTVDDEPNVPLKSHEKPVGFHSGMTDKQVVGVANSATAGQVFDDARLLGRDKPSKNTA